MTKTETKPTCSDQKTRTMKISIQTNKELLIYLCQTLSFLDEIKEEYASPSHRNFALEGRVNLGARLFRSALKVPTPKKITINLQEATLLDFAITHYPAYNEDNNRIARKILGTIQPKLI